VLPPHLLPHHLEVPLLLHAFFLRFSFAVLKKNKSEREKEGKKSFNIFYLCEGCLFWVFPVVSYNQDWTPLA
jgi:hypothetical protein